LRTKGSAIENPARMPVKISGEKTSLSWTRITMQGPWGRALGSGHSNLLKNKLKTPDNTTIWGLID